jgi:outer membrane protein OmpA-like peptidoglycan-associated protein
MEKLNMNTKQLRVIATCFLLLLVFSISGFAQGTRTQEFYAGTFDGTTGLFKTWDAENLQRGETNFTFGYDQFNRDPGQLTIGRAVVGAAVGVVDRFEIFGAWDVRRQIRAGNTLTNKSVFYPDCRQQLCLAGIPPHRMDPNGVPVYSPAFTREAPFMDAVRANDYSDIRIGARVNLLSERRGNPVSFAIAGMGTIPGHTDQLALSRGLSRGTYDIGAFALLSKTAADFIRLHANAGLNFVGEPEHADVTFRNEFIYRAGLELPVHSSVRLIAEAVGHVPFGDGVSGLDPHHPLDLITGIRYFPTRWASFGAGYQASLGNVFHNPDRGGKVNGFVVQGTFGSRRSLESLTVSCSVSRSTIFHDEVATLRANVYNPTGGRLTYNWSSTGGNINGGGDQVDFSSSAPGTFTVTATVSNGRQTATCSSQITVNRRPVAPTVSIEPASFSILPGESVDLRCIASDPNNAILTYAWTVNGQPLAAQGPNITFGSEGRNPGSYNVTCTVSNGDLSASATSNGTIRERPNQPPTISCQPSTVSVASGGTVQLRAIASDPDGDPLTFTWSSPAGAVGGNSDTTTFNAAGVRAGSYNVTATVDDGRGGRASCNITVNVSERIVLAGDNCGYFTSTSSRVDNCAKAIIDDMAVRMRNDASLRATVYGYTDSTNAETTRKGLGEARARAVSAYMQERGIDASRISIVDGGVGTFGDNNTAAGRTLNRRVEIEVAPQ